jgi:molybdenum cofactor synthesis domain-containing protein
MRLARPASPSYPCAVTTAAALIIGDELLSGKVRDTNGPLLIDLLRGLGVRLQRLVYLGDTVAEIAAELRSCSGRFDAVVTSGGIGPTHDDRTIAAVAEAFTVRVVRNAELEAMIRGWWGGRFTEAALRMAEVPEGARLVRGRPGLLPVVVFRNVYLLPGVPRFFEAELDALRAELSGRRLQMSSLFLRCDESRIAPLLGQVDDEFPQVSIGSYPQLEAEDYRIWVTVEAEELDAVELALARLLAVLPADAVVRVERPPSSRPIED